MNEILCKFSITRLAKVLRNEGNIVMAYQRMTKCQRACKFSYLLMLKEH